MDDHLVSSVGAGGTARRPGREFAATLGVLVGLLVTLTGCAAPAPTVRAPTSAATAAASAPPTATSAPDPNAPEVNAAGDIPDNQVFVPFTQPGAGFSASVPQGWARTTGAETVFTDKFNSVRLQSRPLPTAPDATSVSRDEVPLLRGSTPGFVLGTVSTIQRAGGQAVLVTYRATSTPDPVTGKSVIESVERYEFWRSGRAAVLVLSGPQGADNVDPWRTITNSFRWL